MNKTSTMHDIDLRKSITFEIQAFCMSKHHAAVQTDDNSGYYVICNSCLQLCDQIEGHNGSPN
jgi:hypothetical protein